MLEDFQLCSGVTPEQTGLWKKLLDVRERVPFSYKSCDPHFSSEHNSTITYALSGFWRPLGD